MANRQPMIDELVSYYLNGWRTGYLVEIDGQNAKIRPMSPFGGGHPRCIWLPLEDVKGI